jgi:uroporphyrinogen-III synthase
MVRFALPEDTAELDGTLRRIGEYDWWLLTSQNAVQFAAKRAAALGIELAKTAGSVNIAAVGSATAAAAERYGLRTSCIAKTHSEGLAQELAEKVCGKRVVLLRSELADESMPAVLREHGAEVTEAVAYRVLPPEEREQRKLREMNWQRVDAAIFFSPSALKAFVDAIGTSRVHELCDEIIFVAIGPTTAGAIRERGFPRKVQAEDTTNEAAVNALEVYLRRAEAHVEARTERR